MITSAACKATVNGEENIFPCHRHSDFYLWMKLLHCNYSKPNVKEGFIDWNPETRITRFVDRQEAMVIARKCNQLLCSEEAYLTTLFSEDLY